MEHSGGGICLKMLPESLSLSLPTGIRPQVVLSQAQLHLGFRLAIPFTSLVIDLDMFGINWVSGVWEDLSVLHVNLVHQRHGEEKNLGMITLPLTRVPPRIGGSATW